MKLFKDRYSQAIILFVIVFIFFALDMKFKNRNLTFVGATIGINAFIYLIIIRYSSARIHLTDKQKKDLPLQYKGETDCGFTTEYKSKIDGIKLNEKRYKAVNGTDIYISKENKIKACGPGSALIQYLAGAGTEPAEIQKDDCW
jgi:amino acid permease